MIRWEFLHRGMSYEMLGLIPSWLTAHDKDGAVKQIDKNYKHGGGWSDYNGFKMKDDGTLVGEGDPPLRPLARAKLRDETIYFYQHAWMAVRQPDGKYRVARID